MKRFLAVALVCLLFASLVHAKEDTRADQSSAAQGSVPPSTQPSDPNLTNADVIDLVSLGLSDGVIIDKIMTSPNAFDTSIGGLKALKAAKVPDTVIRVMITTRPGMNSQDSTSSVVTPTSSDPGPAAKAPVTQTDPPPPFHSTDGKIRIYITDHPIYESTGIIRGGSHASGHAYVSPTGAGSASVHSDSAVAGVSHTQAGDDPRTVEIQADVVKACPVFIQVSNNPDRADYVLVFRRQGGKRSGFFAFGGLTGLAVSALSKVDGASLFQQNGDMIYATKENTVEKAISDICAHVPLPKGMGTTPTT